MTTVFNYDDTINCEKNKLVDDYFTINAKKEVVPIDKNIKSLNPLQTLAIADTFHDLANDREGYNSSLFSNKLVNYLLAGENILLDDKIYKQTNSYESYLFGPGYKNSIKSGFEPKINDAYEKKYGLQPADVSITYDEIIAGGDVLENKVKLSKGSINLITSLNTCFEEYSSNFKDAIRDKKMKQIAEFIKKYLYSENFGDIKTPLLENNDKIRMLFDSGTKMIGSIFGVEGSGGIRFNAMSCTADSASTSDELLDPTLPNFYEKDREVKISTNYFTCDKISATFKVNDKRNFGEDGINCFSVNFTGIDKFKETANEFQSTASYYFGQMKDKQNVIDYTSPCGTAGAGVPYIGQVFKALDEAVNTLQGKKQKTDIGPVLNQFKGQNSRGRITVCDGRILNLLNKPYTVDDINLLQKLVVDYKRTGDYEQILTVLRQTKDGNVGNYTFSTGDLLAALCARMHQIPTIYQIGNTGRIVLYRSDYYRGSQANRQEFILQEKTKKLQEFKEGFEKTNKQMIDEIIHFLDVNYNTLAQIRGYLYNYVSTKVLPQDYISQITIYSIVYKINYLMKLIHDVFSETSLSILPIIKKIYSETIDIDNIDELLDETNTLLENTIFKISLYLDSEFSELKDNVLREISPNYDTITIPSLSLVIKKHITKDSKSNSLRVDIGNLFDEVSKFKKLNASSSAREASKTNILKTANVYYNKTISSINNFIKKRVHFENSNDLIEAEERIDLTTIDLHNIEDKINQTLLKVRDYVKKTIELAPTVNIMNIGELKDKIEKAFIEYNATYFHIPAEFIESKKRKSEEQTGGAIQDVNKRIIYVKVQKILLTIFDKCNIFMRGLVSQIEINPSEKYVVNTDETFLNFLQKISIDYEDSIEDLRSSLYNNLLFDLEELAGNFMVGDILPTSQTPDAILDLETMLRVCNLTNVNFILFLLSFSKNVSTNNYEYYLYGISLTDEPNKIPMQTFPELKAIYYSELTTSPDVSREVITIVLFGLLEYFYYFLKERKSNMSTFIDYDLTQGTNKDVSNLLKTFQSSPQTYLQVNLFSHIRFITTKLANIMKINTETSYTDEKGQARGVGRTKRTRVSGGKNRTKRRVR